MTAFWIGVASHDHVRAGVEGGFCQLAHGKAAPVARLQLADRIVYYSPRELMAGGAPVQAFTAIGEVLAEKPHQVDVGGGFKPYRRDVRFFDAQVASITAAAATALVYPGQRVLGPGVPAQCFPHRPR